MLILPRKKLSAAISLTSYAGVAEWQGQKSSVILGRATTHTITMSVLHESWGLCGGWPDEWKLAVVLHFASDVRLCRSELVEKNRQQAAGTEYSHLILCLQAKIDGNRF